MYKNQASQKVAVFAYASDQHASLNPGEPVTGDQANITVYLRKDGVTAESDATTGVGTVTQIDATNMPGWYELTLTQAETNVDFLVWAGVSGTTGVLVEGGMAHTIPGSSTAVASDVKEISGSTAAADIRAAVGLFTNNLDTQLAALSTLLGTPDGATIAADLLTLLNRLTATRAGYLDASISSRASSSTFTGITSLENWMRALARSDGADTTALGELNLSGGTYDETQNSLEAIRDRGDADWSAAAASAPNMLLDAEIASVTNQTTFVLASGSTNDDAYNGQAIVLYDDSNSDFPSVRVVTSYNGTTKTVVIDSAPDFTLGADDSVKIFVTAPGTSAPTVGEITADIDANSTQLAAILTLLGTPNFATIVGDIEAVYTTVGDILINTGTSIPALIAALNDPSATTIRDALLDFDLDGASPAGGTFAAYIKEILTDTGTTIPNLVSQAVPQRLVAATVDTLSSQTVFTLDTGSSDDDAYNGCLIVLTDQSTAAQKAIGVVSDYVGATKQVTLVTDPGIFTLATGDYVDICAVSLPNAPTDTSIADAVLDEVFEGSTTLRQFLRLTAAVLYGKMSGGGTSTLTFRDEADSKDRITATVDGSSNRTTIVLDKD